MWVGGVGCWRGISKLRRCDHHPCEVLQFNQCSDLQEDGRQEGINLLLSKQFVGKVIGVQVVGVDVSVGWWCGVLAWDFEVKALRSSPM